MSQEIQDNLFKEFYTKGKNKNSYGVGIGLCVCKNLAGILGPFQKINVTSEEKKGSIFSFVIHRDASNSPSNDLQD